LTLIEEHTMTYQRPHTAPRDAHANDQDKHGRKQNTGTNATSVRGKGSHRDTGIDGADGSGRGKDDKQP
jgi:hypothetical protein